MCRSVFVRILFRSRSMAIQSVLESFLSCLFACINASDNFEELSCASIAVETGRRIHAEFFNRVMRSDIRLTNLFFDEGERRVTPCFVPTANE